LDNESNFDPMILNVS